MLFNSGLFLQFFAAFLLLYYAVRNHLGARNGLILLASYAFYGAWDYRFLALLIGSSLFDFAVGLGLERLAHPARRKGLLLASLAVNLGILGFFKYWDFFAESFAQLLGALGVSAHPQTLGIILPVGISFYTFQSMSYAIDVYRREIPAARNLAHFLAYVAFFPQLVAGPIERARHLLPQFARTLVITRGMLAEGLWLCAWGMFKKVAVADNLAPLVEMAYGHPAPSAPLVILGTMAFALQIYGDFSGYSDIARGTARLLGFDIMMNFNLPLTAASLREFWQRWHISLSTWLRDYLYIPLGGNRLGASRTTVNLCLTMLLGGLWHGASWNFALWGAWHGMGLAAARRLSDGSIKPWSLGRWLGTTAFLLYGWMLFRAGSLSQVIELHRAFGFWAAPDWMGTYLLHLVVFSAPLIGMEAWLRRAGGVLAPLAWKPWLLGLAEGILLAAILLFWEKDKVPFIYFQF